MKFIYRFFAELKKKPYRFILGFSLTLAFTLNALGFLYLPGVSILEDHFYDLKVSLSTVKTPETRVAILDVDEKSLAQYGHWPWGRALMAKLNNKLFDEQKIAVLGYDIVWAEPDAANPVNVLKQIDAEALKSASAEGASKLVDYLQKNNPDTLFANSMKDRAIALGYYFNNEAEAVKANMLPAPIFSFKELPRDTNQIVDWRAYTGNLADLNSAAASGGYFNPLVDEDGIIRKVPLLAVHNEHYYQNLTLAMLRLALGNMPAEPVVVSDDSGYHQLEILKIGPLEIPVAPDASIFVPYRGKQHSFEYYSAADVLSGKLAPATLEGKIIIMGSSAPGLRDQRAVPLENVYPGVEIHANVISGILDGKIKYTPSYAAAIEVLQVFLAGLLATLLLPMVGAVLSSLLTTLMIVVGLLFNFYLWNEFNWVVPAASAILVVVLIYIGNILFGYFVESRLKKQMSGLFGQYVPSELVEKMAEDPEHYGMQGKDAHLTILFSDVRGFTGISEKLSAPELSAYINEYLNTMTAIIMDEMGTLDKYIGDAIMAFWGAPVENEKHTYFALKAAFKMRDAAVALSESFASRGLPAFNIGIGLNTGHVRVGDMGSDLRRSYTVMGDAVNLASRLEGATKQYGVGILVSSYVVESAPEFIYRKIDRVRVKGKNVAVTIYEPVGLKDEVSQEEKQSLTAWDKALELYFKQDWDGFIQHLNAIKQNYGSKPIYDLYEARVNFYKQNPLPEEWDGVTTMTSK